MSNQLWILTENSLKDLEQFFAPFADAEAYTSIFKILFDVSSGRIRFTPSLTEVENDVLGLVEELLASVQNIPRVETKIFSSLQDSSLALTSMSIDCDRVKHGQYIRNVLLKNIVGVQKYASAYDSFKILYSQAYEKRIVDFLEVSHTLFEYEDEIKRLKAFVNEIALQPSKVWISMFFLDCEELKKNLFSITDALIRKIIECVADIARRNNSKLVHKSLIIRGYFDFSSYSFALLCHYIVYVNNLREFLLMP
jgi:dynein heavy chain, axonemal